MTSGATPEPVPTLRVALTFDVEFGDRPAQPGVTLAILDALWNSGTHASMFLQGRWAEAEPRLARRIATDGHVVGNHSHHHARMTILTGAGIVRDVTAAERAIEAATGVSPRPWFRCPFGAGAQTARVVTRLAGAGYVDVGWHVDAKDWAGGRAATLERRVVDAVVAQGDGAVVLMHGWPDATALAVPGIVRGLGERGATFVGIDELDALPGRRV